MAEEISVAERILRASASISEHGRMDENLTRAKHQAIAAYNACERHDLSEAVTHLCHAVEALMHKLWLVERAEGMDEPAFQRCGPEDPPI